MKRIVLLAALVLAGCEAPSSNSTQSVTEGVVKEVTFVHEDSLTNQMIVEFDDGRVVKFRCRYNTPLTIQKGYHNRIYHDGLNFARAEVPAPLK